jgi:hypothetical protein
MSLLIQLIAIGEAKDVVTKRTAAKPVAKSGKDKTTVSIENDPLADLGLTDETPAQQPQAKATAKAPAKATEKPAATPAPTPEPETAAETEQTETREEVEVGELEFGFVDFIPTAKRRTEGSKYKFDQLQAPQVVDGKTRYAQFTVKLQDGVDADKLRRSVQSATTQANRQGSQAGKYFVSRSVQDDKGAFIGMQVIRTDVKPK